MFAYTRSIKATRGMRSASSHYAANWSTLCPELIYEILTYCLLGVTLYTDDPGSFPWYLGHICQSWRSVFVSSPCFWDRFSFEICRTEEISLLQRALALVELCIERTKDRPFSFRFMVTFHNMNRLSPLFQILDTVVAHADRWRAASLIANGIELKKPLNKAKGRLRQLHSLRIGHFFGYSTPSDVFQDAPNLTRVWARDYYQLPWSTLAVLHVDQSLSTHRFFENLHKMTSLEELVINGFHVDHDNVTSTRPIELPSLKMLSIDHFPPSLHLKTPALETLYLVGSQRAGLPTAITLLRGVSHLKTLSLYVGNVYDARVIEWTPELDHLILSCDYKTSFGAFRSLFQSLASHSTAYSLRRTNIGFRDQKPDSLGLSVFIINVLSTVIQSWEKYQFPKLRFVSAHVNNDHNIRITSAIADLMQVGADKGIEMDVNSSPLPTALPFFKSW
jgi:hypothetical protein